jgi:hypothetical protein
MIFPAKKTHDCEAICMYWLYYLLLAKLPRVMENQSMAHGLRRSKRAKKLPNRNTSKGAQKQK